MKANLLTLSEMLAKLDKLTYVSERNDTLETKEGFSITYDTKLHHSKNGGFSTSVQLVLRVMYKGQNVRGFGWGCCEADDTKMIVDWFIEKEVKAREFHYSEEDKTRDLGLTILSAL